MWYFVALQGFIWRIISLSVDHSHTTRTHTTCKFTSKQISSIQVDHTFRRNKWPSCCRFCRFLWSQRPLPVLWLLWHRQQGGVEVRVGGVAGAEALTQRAGPDQAGHDFLPLLHELGVAYAGHLLVKQAALGRRLKHVRRRCLNDRSRATTMTYLRSYSIITAFVLLVLSPVLPVSNQHCG